MKKRKQAILAVLALSALLGLLTIQVFWTFHAAETREDQFNQRVSMVMARTTEELCENQSMCSSLGTCCLARDSDECSLELDSRQKALVDSLLKYYMNFYKIDLDYNFKIVRTDTLAAIASGKSKDVFCQDLAGMQLPGSYQLSMHLPDSSQYILAEMGPMFFVSVLLILLLVAVFVMTMRTLSKEKAVLQRTTDFVNNMTHELKTPLANISLAASMIGRDDLAPDKRKKYNAIIRDENEKLKEQVERLLNLAALEQGNLPNGKMPVNMSELAGELKHCMEARFAEAGGTLSLHLHAENDSVYGDKLLLANAASNLLENALKYSGEKPAVEMSLRSEGNWLLLTVSDQGPGIAEKDQALIFEPFYRVTDGDVHNVKGFGLGLPFVKKIAEIHGGSITVKSTPGKGSVFTLKLPLIV
ncbi:MAG: histidine kinase [Bacteroidetes bacterium]|nr:MAG: histidine kinase [Bacteroidota bacterium]